MGSSRWRSFLPRPFARKTEKLVSFSVRSALPQEESIPVILAHAGIHLCDEQRAKAVDSRVRGNDERRRAISKATKWRQVVAVERPPSRSVFHAKVGIQGHSMPIRKPLETIPLRTATTWRKAVAMGASPWDAKRNGSPSPEGTAGGQRQRYLPPLRGFERVTRHDVHGLTPVATACRPFGTLWQRSFPDQLNRILKTPPTLLFAFYFLLFAL